jgi:geranylgeranyl diphosphate synthase type II
MHSFRELLGLFEQRVASPDLFPAQPANLYDPCRYLLRLGGKRIRPVACLMAHELFVPVKEEVWNAALAIELFHNFTLIHDDIMDKAPLRRGFPTIHAKYGLTAGILGGDAMSIYAYQCLSKVNTNFREVLHVFNTTAIQVCDGQQMDMDFELRNNVSSEEYIEMISLKTSVLLAASLKIGALVAGASMEDADELYRFGKALGIAFQLQDDYLDAFGSKKTGKQIGGDILANKKTFLHIQAVDHADPLQQQRIAHWLQQDDQPERKISEMLDLFRATEADKKCRAAVAAYSDTAFESLGNLRLENDKKASLRALATDLLNREQ